MIRKAAIAAGAALFVAIGLPSTASAFTIIDPMKVALILGGVTAPVTVPCGGERIDLRGAVEAHVLVHKGGSLEYHINAMDAVGVGSATGTTFRLVGAANGRARAGETLLAHLTLVGSSGQRLAVEAGIRITTGSRAQPPLALASIRIVMPCDPGTITLSDAQTGGFGDYTILLIGTALDPSSGVAIFGVTARGSLPYTQLLGTEPVHPDGTVASLPALFIRVRVLLRDWHQRKRQTGHVEHVRSALLITADAPPATHSA